MQKTLDPSMFQVNDYKDVMCYSSIFQRFVAFKLCLTHRPHFIVINFRFKKE